MKKGKEEGTGKKPIQKGGRRSLDATFTVPREKGKKKV